MGTKNYRNSFIAISLLVSVTILGSIPTKSLAETNPLKGCDGSEKNNWLKEIPGYPSKNPEKTLYHELPYRANAGQFIIIMKNDNLCTLDMDVSTEVKDKARALKKFSELYSGSKPLRICEIPQSRHIMTCKR